jgi:DNA helicase-2/ATP-dependent DNA helicase PcrA
VAITRAKEFLTISLAQNRYRFGQIRVSEPSRFLEEINVEHFDFAGGFGSARSSNMNAAAAPTRAGVTGNFAQPRLRALQKTANTTTVPADFKAAQPDEIRVGMQVLHLKFGQGEILQVEGAKDGKVAAIRFQNDDVSERRIVLKFAKLQIL